MHVPKPDMRLDDALDYIEKFFIEYEPPDIYAKQFSIDHGTLQGKLTVALKAVKDVYVPSATCKLAINDNTPSTELIGTFIMREVLRLSRTLTVLLGSRRLPLTGKTLVTL